MKTKLNQTVVAIFTATLLTTSPAVFAEGIPTVDLANIKQSVENFMQDAANHAETIEQWAKQAESMFQQIEHLKTQIENQIQMIENVKNVKDLESALNVMNDFMGMPDEWRDIYATVQDLDPTGELKKLKFDPNLEIKNRMEDLKVVEKIQKGFKESKDRLQQANDLVKSANSELALQKATAIILAEQTRIQQAQFEYNMLQQKYAADEKANHQKEIQLNECIWSAHGSVSEIKKCEKEFGV